MSLRADTESDRLWVDERSVSPVIATVLMVAIVIVIAASIGAVGFGFTDRLGETTVAAGDDDCVVEGLEFDPNDVSTFANQDFKCVLWFDASQEGYSSSGEPVEGWTDRSRNEYNTSVAGIGSSTKPEGTSDVDGTGVPGVMFDGGTDALQTDVTTSDTNLEGRSAFTAISVIRPDGGSNGAVLQIGNAAEYGDNQFAFGPDTTIDQWFIAYTGAYDADNSFGNWVVVTHVYDGDTLTTYSNGKFKYKKDNYRRDFTDTPIYIGLINKDPDSPAPRYLDGAIAEMAVFDQELSTDEREWIECELDNKYGTAVSVAGC